VSSNEANSSAPRAGALTIDVEDYYHVHALANVIDRADWDTLPSHVEANTNRLLDLFAAKEATATFFTLGSVGQRFPQLLHRIVRRARETLEDIGAAPVRGYRAPSFSIDTTTPWAYEVLAETGHSYSSSSHPIAHDHYGDADAPRHPFVEPSAGIVEIPITTLQFGKRRYPGAGGGFFRAFPLAHSRMVLRRMAKEGVAPNFYLHPWEIDPDQPRYKEAPLKSRLRHYIGLSRCERKLSRLLDGMAWTRMDRAYKDWLEPAAADENSSAAA